MNKSKNILVTGASTGIGHEISKAFLTKGYTVFGSVRKTSDAEHLKATLGKNFRPIFFDVTDHQSVEVAAEQLTEELGDEGLGGLVNNAGIAVGGPILHLPIADLREQFEVNLFGLVRVTQLFAPLLGARENHMTLPGRIIQISSVAGKMGMPFMGAYSGSKHALEGLSDSLRRELQLYGIDVVIIEPGAVKTPIWQKSGTEAANAAYLNTNYGPAIKKFQQIYVGNAAKNGLPAALIGQQTVVVFEKKHPRVRYAFVPKKLTNWTIPRLMPSRKLDRFLGKSIGLIQ